MKKGAGYIMEVRNPTGTPIESEKSPILFYIFTVKTRLHTNNKCGKLHLYI